MILDVYITPHAGARMFLGERLLFYAVRPRRATADLAVRFVFDKISTRFLRALCLAMGGTMDGKSKHIQY